MNKDNKKDKTNNNNNIEKTRNGKTIKTKLSIKDGLRQITVQLKNRRLQEKRTQILNEQDEIFVANKFKLIYKIK